MADGTNIHLAGVQINFKTWERFNLENLTNDGVVLFQYLVFHCQSNAEWTHSDNGLRAELGIKRSRLTTLRREFESWGILTTRIVKDRNDNDIRAYRLNFLELSKVSILKALYREHSPSGEPYNLNEYAEVYKALSANQPKLGGNKSKVEHQKESEIKKLAAELKEEFDSRRKDFNAQQAKSKKRTASGTIVFSPTHLKKLANAVRAIGNKEYIKSAFTAYCDTLNQKATNSDGKDTELLMPSFPRSPLNYFLSYSTGEVGGTESYNVIYAFGEYFAGHYGRG